MQYTLLKACLQSLWLQMQALLLQCFGQSTAVLTWGGAGRCQLSDRPCPVFQAIESAIGGNAYQHSKVNQWTTNVVEQTLSQLTKLGKPFKYIVTCVIMQKNGAGLHTASSCFWDSSTDGSCTVRWENKTMYCIVSAFGLSI
uniref:Dynein light chain Tctex-type 1 n=3 Tax=Laurasiatheria TaxID=314145 RepID=A0A8D0UZT2_PIG